MPTTSQHPYHPIIYVRGFAATQGEIEETVADPYMGFNIGSTKARVAWTGDVKRFFFESPLVRLMSDHEYGDVFVDGEDLVTAERPDCVIPYRSIIIYRYYDEASKDFGTGETPPIEHFAKGLDKLILRLRDKICADSKNTMKPADFRVHLVAHSMGGLVCRAFLQNPKIGSPEARGAVDKLFTYATPHNGIDVQLIGNVPNWASFHNLNDFNRGRMAEYLDLKQELKKSDDAAVVKGFDPNRIFNLVGTNARDYAVAMGAGKALAGDLSDGLVQIKNATTHGDWNGQHVNSPRAFVYRSHSGHYGIVNSEEGYQNLARFFFGNVRVDGTLLIDKLTLPAKVQKAHDAGKKIRASYHFEVIVSVRGKQWQMHRRTLGENSAVFRKFDDLFQADKTPIRERSPQLFSLFLDGRQRVVSTRRSLGFAVDLAVLVPDYEVDGFLFLNDHYEGGHLFRDRVYVEATPPEKRGEAWKVQYGFESRTPGATDQDAVVTVTGEGIEFDIPIQQPNAPGIDARLRIAAQGWNKV